MQKRLRGLDRVDKFDWIDMSSPNFEDKVRRVSLDLPRNSGMEGRCS
jgi:hypothetical protein